MADCVGLELIRHPDPFGDAAAYCETLIGQKITHLKYEGVWTIDEAWYEDGTFIANVSNGSDVKRVRVMDCIEHHDD